MARSPLGGIFSFFTFLLATVGSVVAFALAIISFVSSSKTGEAIHDVYWFKYMPYQLNPSYVTGSIPPSERYHTNSQASQWGIYDFYTVGPSGICAFKYIDNTETDYDYLCFKKLPQPFWITWSEIAKDATSKTNVTITVPDHIQSYESTLKTGLQAFYIFYIMSLILCGLVLLGGIGSVLSTKAAWPVWFLSLAGTLFMTITASIGTGLYVTYRKRFESHGNDYMTVQAGKSGITLTWLAVAGMIWSNVWLLLLAVNKKRQSQPPRNAYYYYPAPPAGAQKPAQQHLQFNTDDL